MSRSLFTVVEYQIYKQFLKAPMLESYDSNICRLSYELSPAAITSV